MPRARPAEAKPPASTTLTKVAMLVVRSIRASSSRSARSVRLRVFDAKKMDIALRRDFRLGETCCNCNATIDFLLTARALARQRIAAETREQPDAGARHPCYRTPSTTAAALRSWRRDGAGIARQRVNAPASSADDSG